MNMLQKLSITLLGSVLAALANNAPASAASINFASLSEGASVISWSSQLSPNETNFELINGGLVTARQNLLSSSKTAWLSAGETGFIFGRNDDNQRLIIDLGENRLLDEIGALLSPYPGDREVWDYFEVRTSIDNVNYSPWGIVGNKDEAADIVESLNLIDQQESRLVRYIEYGFGPHSFDHNSGGSRVVTLYANQIVDVSVPEPSSAIGLLIIGAVGAGSLLKRKRQAS